MNKHKLLSLQRMQMHKDLIKVHLYCCKKNCYLWFIFFNVAKFIFMSKAVAFLYCVTYYLYAPDVWCSVCIAMRTVKCFMCPYLRRISDHLMILHYSISKQLLYSYMHPLNRWQTQRWMEWTWQNLCLSLSLSLSLSLPAGWLHKDMHSHLKMHLSTKCSLCSRLSDKLYVCVRETRFLSY